MDDRRDRRDRLRRSILEARYLEALDRADRRTQAEIERQGHTDPELAEGLRQLRVGLVEEALTHAG